MGAADGLVGRRELEVDGVRTDGDSRSAEVTCTL